MHSILILDGYGSVIVFLMVAVLIPVLALTSSLLLRPQGGGPEQKTTYESGIEPMGESWIQFNIRYYMFALVFVLFDVETLFLYPWAITFHQLGLSAFIEVLIFITILLLGLVYAWRKGALEWS
uniref:NAD(P)H-quinone oxidoreductase subunit 3, chloroplastic n=1 Tax=Nephroselmis astigmatica TaxID=259378 RepID=A0A088CK71_9CHLO|nr:subunit 3 of NADH-plastoquinone oxidoreductase [Nephroselmis astigmatica]AID67677.1 subunit 3 of NADH-plastoquinone oxidoreductase [Nephroselmis astigmatica]